LEQRLGTKDKGEGINAARIKKQTWHEIK
jgi:hypothetical protein